MFCTTGVVATYGTIKILRGDIPYTPNEEGAMVLTVSLGPIVLLLTIVGAISYLVHKHRHAQAGK